MGGPGIADEWECLLRPGQEAMTRVEGYGIDETKVFYIVKCFDELWRRNSNLDNNAFWRKIRQKYTLKQLGDDAMREKIAEFVINELWGGYGSLSYKRGMSGSTRQRFSGQWVGGLEHLQEDYSQLTPAERAEVA